MPIATAPVRVCDAGGWTDTWFARQGVVCSIAVRPGVRVEVVPGEGPGPSSALLDAAMAEAGASGAHVRVRSGVPAGSSLGTSAAVVVATLAALGVPRAELAARAHRVETERLGLQSGVQDQIAAVHGGAALLDIAYPDVRRRALPIPAQLGRRLVTVFLGEHRSSAVHERVIAELTADGGALGELRRCATAAADALEAGDLRAYGAALAANTEAQRALHPSLVSPAAQRVIDAGRSVGALGWKVNGAGGDGGTVTVLLGDRPLPTVDARVLRLRPSPRGVLVEEAARPPPDPSTRTVRAGGGGSPGHRRRPS